MFLYFRAASQGPWICQPRCTESSKLPHFHEPASRISTIFTSVFTNNLKKWRFSTVFFWFSTYGPSKCTPLPNFWGFSTSSRAQAFSAPLLAINLWMSPISIIFLRASSGGWTAYPSLVCLYCLTIISEILVELATVGGETRWLSGRGCWLEPRGCAKDDGDATRVDAGEQGGSRMARTCLCYSTSRDGFHPPLPPPSITNSLSCPHLRKLIKYHLKLFKIIPDNEYHAFRACAVGASAFDVGHTGIQSLLF